MTIEIEAKMQLADLDATERLLVRLGARRGQVVLQTDRFFDKPDGCLRKADQALRIRVSQPVDGRAEETMLTYKGPRDPGQLKSRQEIQMVVSSAEAAAQLLQQLGFSEVFSFQKKRRMWHVDDCHVALDHLPHIGDYIEIEGPSGQAVELVSTKLAMQDVPLIRSDYVSLLTTHLAEHGLGGNWAHFDNGAANTAESSG